MNYDAIVIGAGHAGCEAALALARTGNKTALITGNLDFVASMPCNPSIGGPAKGVLVREIDALGGEMGKVADKTYIQMRLLNASKGPAVRALRCQSDKHRYHDVMLETLKKQDNLDLIEAIASSFIIENDTCKGVILKDGRRLDSKVVVVTTGTYMNSRILCGHSFTVSGPDNQPTDKGLSDHFKELGFDVIRLKTGTPARIDKDSIDFSKGERADGDQDNMGFSYETKDFLPLDKQVPCYLIHTTEETKKIVFENLDKSSMYGGIVEGVGPRYCPSIEDKFVRFSDKEAHQIFLEPISLDSQETYIQGFSTSMPHDVQERMLRSLPGLENCKIIKYAYAIEYDAINPLELRPSLETKRINNLFLAGQINGTSGYEEAACQGLMAGINANLKMKNREPLILRRDEAYTGVLIDDLITKGTKEPYRMLTSRSEYRLLLRHDNADIRLRKYGHDVGLISDELYQEFLNKMNRIEAEKMRLSSIYLTEKEETNNIMLSIGSSPIKEKQTALNLLKRPEMTYPKLLMVLNEESKLSNIEEEQLEIDVKYEGYIKKAKKQAEDFLKVENLKIPEDIDYSKVGNLALEARQKLEKIRPISVGQASRISGVNPADISILLVYIKSRK